MTCKKADSNQERAKLIRKIKQELMAQSNPGLAELREELSKAQAELRSLKRVARSGSGQAAVSGGSIVDRIKTKALRSMSVDTRIVQVEQRIAACQADLKAYSATEAKLAKSLDACCRLVVDQVLPELEKKVETVGRSGGQVLVSIVTDAPKPAIDLAEDALTSLGLLVTKVVRSRVQSGRAKVGFWFRFDSPDPATMASTFTF